MKCVEVPKAYAEKTIRLLRKYGVLDTEHLITRRDDRIIIPLRDDKQVLRILADIPLEIISCEPPTRKRVKVRVPAHDVIGNIVIVRENVLEFMDKDELIRVLHTIYPRIRTIYLKKETTGEFRTAVLEPIWGIDDPITINKEYGLSFKIDLKKAYYNPRLAEEHRRIAEEVRDSERIFDLFAGIGGFSIHIASLHRTTIYMNDLNPYAVRLGIENIIINKKKIKGVIIPLCMDSSLIPKYFKQSVFDRVIANNPHYSHLFEHVYRYLLKDNGLLHLYFVSSTKEYDSFLERYFSNWKLLRVRKVIDYAPYVFIWRADLIKP